MGKHDTKLAEAIKAYDTEAINTLIAMTTNIDFQTNQRCTALYTAVECNNVEAAVALLERGASMSIMPKKRVYQNDNAMMFLFKMGASHEEMQLLFLDKLACQQSTLSSDEDKKIIAAIAHSAMLYSTPLVFFRATVASRGKDLYNEQGLNALMTTLNHVVLFAKDAAKYTRKLDNVLEIVDKYPAMAWESLKNDKECDVLTQTNGPTSLMHTEGSTALGMIVYQTISARQSRNRQFETISEKLLQLRSVMETGGIVTGSLAKYQEMVQEDMDNNSKVVLYVIDEFVPALWKIMLRPLRIAFAMGTHARLGDAGACGLNCLNTDMIDTIFRNLVLDITIAPHVVKHMLC